MKILIVSPHFPPTNAADMQRVRMVLPYLREVGIESEVLVVDPECVAAPIDPWLEEGLPRHVPIHRTPILGLTFTRIPGLGTLSYRAMGGLRKTGNRLLATQRFNLVYFSTTQFGIHVLGPYWKRKFGTPFTMDYQDPWVNDYYREHPDINPPGGRLKYSIASWLNRRTEPRVLKHCSGITSVSPDYPKQLRDRYDFLPTDWPVQVLPFPGDLGDFEQVTKSGIQQSIFNPSDGFLHWVYIGVAGKIMEQPVKGFFHAIANSDIKGKLRLHFIGTSYAPKGKGNPTIKPLADQFGLADIVQEVTDRIPYSETLSCLMDANALIVPGSDDPAYTASKIYPYLLACKPLLTIFHELSSVVSLIHSVGGAVSVSFSERDSSESIAFKITQNWLANGAYQQIQALDDEAFDPYTGKGSAVILNKFFNAVLGIEQSYG
ncbi:MAG: hypothetical protein V3U75_09730 [Methylococcaceae bacterium]